MRRIPAHGVPLALGKTVVLSSEASHYAADVLRLNVGDPVEVFGDGASFRCTIVGLGPLVVQLDQELDGLANESSCQITLYQAIPKKDRFEWLLEKATELGVYRIVPLVTARSVVRIPRDKVANKLARWQRICDSAARQCGRSVTPLVAPPTPLTAAQSGARHSLELLLDPAAGKSLHGSVTPATVDVGVWVGPEGGFDPTEVELLSVHAVRTRLGPRVLRSETAGIVIVAATQLLAGGLQ